MNESGRDVLCLAVSVTTVSTLRGCDARRCNILGMQLHSVKNT